MPPKGSKAPKASPKAKGDAASSGGGAPEAVVDVSMTDVKVELEVGESDKVNLAYIEKLQGAVDRIKGHPLFQDIENALPLKIIDKAESGVQAPVDAAACQHALNTSTQSYTCGVNLFWLDLLWSPTPGVPLRGSAIEAMTATTFQEPAMCTVHVAVPDKSWNPLEHKGALLRVSPEEITGAIIFAIERDIRDEKPDAILKSWRSTALSTTCVFKVLPSSTDRYWYALQQRENISTTYKAVNRSVFQRMHEISRLIKRMRETRPASEITAHNIAQAYQDNVKMTPGASAIVTTNFVDCVVTIINRMLEEPDISYCLQDLDEKSALTSDQNPFDSHSRLQAMVDKSGKSLQNLPVIVQGIWYYWVKGTTRSFSHSDIKGTASTGNRGVADLIMFKHQLKSTLLAWGRKKFPDSVDWIDGPVANATTSFKSWYCTETAGNQAWRAGRRASETKWLNFVIEVTFGRLYDAPIKLCIKSSKTPEDALMSPGLVETLDEINAKLTLEDSKNKANTDEDNVAPDTDEKPEDQSDELVFMLPSKDGGCTSVRASSIADTSKKEMLDMIISQTKAQIAANIHLVPIKLLEDSDGESASLTTRMARTPACKFEGAPNTTNPSKSKYVGIFFDVKLAGEANSRPALRTPPLQADRYKTLISACLQRHGPTEDLTEGDIFFILDGGKAGNQSEFLKVFPKLRSAKQFLVFRDEESLTQRYNKVQGVGVCKGQQENLLAVSAGTLALKRYTFQNLRGTSAATVLGPVVLTPPSEVWQLPWSIKKQIYGAENLIAVGGKADDEGLDEAGGQAKAEKTRNSNTRSPEPVFHHNLPPMFYEDIIKAFGLAAVVDCTPGDGSLALSAYKANVVYTGLTFNAEHSKHLQHHLDSTIWKAMATDTDTLFDPRLLTVLQDNTTDKQKPKTKAKPKQESTKRKRDAGEASDREPAGGDAAAGKEPDALSGDDE